MVFMIDRPVTPVSRIGKVIEVIFYRGFGMVEYIIMRTANKGVSRLDS